LQMMSVLILAMTIALAFAKFSGSAKPFTPVPVQVYAMSKCPDATGNSEIYNFVHTLTR
jgi:hypothetical protein